MFVYDLDGVLADTKEFVLQCYRSAEVEPPDDFWGKPWQSWLDDPAKHDLKNTFLHKHKHLIKPLPILQVFNRLGGVILTGASAIGANTTFQAIELDTRVLESLYTGKTIQEKADLLNILTRMGKRGLMFEDTKENVTYLRKNTEWQIVHVGQF